MVRTVVRPVERARGEAWSVVGLLGAVFQSSVFTGVIGTEVALVSLASVPSPDANAIQGLWVLQRALFTLNGAALTVTLGGLAIGAARAGVIPGWHGAIGIAGAVLLFVSAVLTVPIVEGSTVIFVGLFGFLLWLIWHLIMGVRMVLRPDFRHAEQRVGVASAAS